jgi:POT family proton-dependent oligopeptide transporter
VTTQSGASRKDTAFLGHPAGLGWLAATEFWERFSYYGMLTLLVLYMTHQLLQPGHVDHVIGFGLFRRAIEYFSGPLSPLALASRIYGLYSGTVYLVPIFGGFLADRVLGRTRTVVLGASLMALGHFLMAFEASFLFALLCLLLGSGCFKGNLATQVGDLYGHEDPRRADAFQIYTLAIQLAVIGSPILCGWLASRYGWQWGFGVAGVGMLIGLTIYLSARGSLAPDRPRTVAAAAEPRAPLTRADWKVIALLIFLVPVLATASVGNQQIFDAYLVWAEKTYNLSLLGFSFPVTWLISFDSFVSTITLALVVLFWRWWATRWREPDELQKIILGVTIAAVGVLALAAAAAQFAATGHRVSLWWGVLFEILNDLGFANVFSIGLALYSRAAPKGLGGTLVAIYLINLFLGNMFVGYLGGLLETMSGVSFWLLHAGLIGASAVVLLGIRILFGRILAPEYGDPPASS